MEPDGAEQQVLLCTALCHSSSDSTTLCHNTLSLQLTSSPQPWSASSRFTNLEKERNHSLTNQKGIEDKEMEIICVRQGLKRLQIKMMKKDHFVLNTGSKRFHRHTKSLVYLMRFNQWFPSKKLDLPYSWLWYISDVSVVKTAGPSQPWESWDKPLHFRLSILLWSVSDGIEHFWCVMHLVHLVCGKPWSTALLTAIRSKGFCRQGKPLVYPMRFNQWFPAKKFHSYFSSITLYNKQPVTATVQQTVYDTAFHTKQYLLLKVATPAFYHCTSIAVRTT